MIEILYTAPFIIPIYMSLNPVSETIYDAQGLRLINFLVFRNKSLKEVYGPIVAKNGIELNYFLLYKLWS